MTRAFQLAGTGAASAIYIKAVMVGVTSVETTRVHKGGKIGVPHFLDFATCCANQVSMGQGDALILCLHSLEHMAPEHSGSAAAASARETPIILAQASAARAL